MKKKILASLLAVCMFVGMAVPAFAASSQSGTNEEITALKFPATSYTVKNGVSKDLALEVQAFAGTKKLVQDPSLVWSVENDSKYAFGIDDNGKVTANEDAGTATVKVTANDGKVVGTVKVNAAKNPVVIATGFTFKTTTATLLTGGGVLADKGNTIQIIPTPKDSTFTVAQQRAISDAVTTDTTLSYKAKDLAGNEVVVPASVAVAEGKVTLTYANGAGDSTLAPATFVVTIATPATAKPTVKPTIAIVNGAGTVKVTATKLPTAETAAAIAASFVGAKVTVNKIAYTAFAASAPDATIVFKADKKGVIAAADKVAETTPAVAVENAAAATYTVAAGNVGGAKDATLSAINVAKVDPATYTLSVAFPRADGTVPTAKSSRSIKLSGAAAVPATKIYAAGNIIIEVGEKASMAKQFKQGPSASNMTSTPEYGLEAADSNSVAVDFADFTNTNSDDKSEIIGVAVGANRVTATANGETVSVLVTVVEAGKKTPAVKPTTATYAKLVVGGTYKIVVKDAGTVVPTFKTLTDKIVSVDKDGNVKAIAAGTGKVEVKVGTETIWVNVAVTAAPVVVAPDKKPTTPPQTGISLF